MELCMSCYFSIYVLLQTNTLKVELLFRINVQFSSVQFSSVQFIETSIRALNSTLAVAGQA
jgi:hypothetical protein